MRANGREMNGEREQNKSDKKRWTETVNRCLFSFSPFPVILLVPYRSLVQGYKTKIAYLLSKNNPLTAKDKQEG